MRFVKKTVDSILLIFWYVVERDNCSTYKNFFENRGITIRFNWGQIFFRTTDIGRQCCPPPAAKFTCIRDSHYVGFLEQWTLKNFWCTRDPTAHKFCTGDAECGELRKSKRCSGPREGRVPPTGEVLTALGSGDLGQWRGWPYKLWSYWNSNIWVFRRCMLQVKSNEHFLSPNVLTMGQW